MTEYNSADYPRSGGYDRHIQSVQCSYGAAPAPSSYADRFGSSPYDIRDYDLPYSESPVWSIVATPDAHNWYLRCTTGGFARHFGPIAFDTAAQYEDHPEWIDAPGYWMPEIVSRSYLYWPLEVVSVLTR